MYIEKITIRERIYEFEFDQKPTEEEIAKAISQAMEGIGGRPRDRE